MSDEQSRLPTAENVERGAINKPDQEGKGTIQALPEAERIRAVRAKLIEETTYRLTDLFTIVSARIEILSDRAPAALREELAAIRKVVLHGVELNKRLFQVAQACRGASSPNSTRMPVDSLRRSRQVVPGTETRHED